MFDSLPLAFGDAGKAGGDLKVCQVGVHSGSVTIRLSVLKEAVEPFADVLLPITPMSYVNSTRYTHTEKKL